MTERRFTAMGTRAHIVIVGPSGTAHLERAVSRVGDLEQRWSRFIESSEVSAINRAGGAPVVVSEDTIGLVEHGVTGWRLTNGAFDPSMEHQLVSAGYNRPFLQMRSGDASHGGTALLAAARPTSGCAEIVVDRAQRTVSLPAGVGFDPGGFGKGLAADIIAAEALRLGAAGILVNIGGDLTARGEPPSGEEWIVTIREATVSADDLSTVRLRDAGMATSTINKRRWNTADGEHHHILDPKDGRSSRPRAVLASVIAGNAWWAEVCATSLLAGSEGADHGDVALQVLADGSTHRSGDFERFEI